MVLVGCSACRAQRLRGFVWRGKGCDPMRPRGGICACAVSNRDVVGKKTRLGSPRPERTSAQAHNGFAPTSPHQLTLFGGPGRLSTFWWWGDTA